MKPFDTFEILPVEDDFNPELLEHMKKLLLDKSVGYLEIPIEFIDRLQVEFHDGNIISLRSELAFPYPNKDSELSEKTKLAFNAHVKSAKLYVRTNLLQSFINSRVETMFDCLKHS